MVLYPLVQRLLERAGYTAERIRLEVDDHARWLGLRRDEPIVLEFDLGKLCFSPELAPEVCYLMVEGTVAQPHYYLSTPTAIYDGIVFDL